MDGVLSALLSGVLVAAALVAAALLAAALLGALLAHLQSTTLLAVSVGLTLATETTRSDPVARWRARPSELPTDVPAVFSFLAR